MKRGLMMSLIMLLLLLFRARTFTTTEVIVLYLLGLIMLIVSSKEVVIIYLRWYLRLLSLNLWLLFHLLHFSYCICKGIIILDLRLSLADSKTLILLLNCTSCKLVKLIPQINFFILFRFRYNSLKLILSWWWYDSHALFLRWRFFLACSILLI